jgi:hypothetical protein
MLVDDIPLSRERIIFVCYKFFKQPWREKKQDRFGRKPIFLEIILWSGSSNKSRKELSV